MADICRLIRAAIVDQDDLEAAEGSQLRKRRNQGGNGGGSLVYRYDNGETNLPRSDFLPPPAGMIPK